MADSCRPIGCRCRAAGRNNVRLLLVLLVAILQELRWQQQPGDNGENVAVHGQLRFCKPLGILGPWHGRCTYKLVPSRGRVQLRGQKLVIVESPSKVTLIKRYLGAGFEVLASVGHIRELAAGADLPPEFRKFGIDMEHGFKGHYIVREERKPTVSKLKKALTQADELYLATDDDREGEAIAWHLVEVLKPPRKKPVSRMIFREITKPAIQEAVQKRRDIDQDLVNAQEARRMLDRLYGFSLSKLLQATGAKSAGRVQSPSLRFIVDKEQERRVFMPADYWDLQALFSAPSGAVLNASLVSIDERHVACGKDFNPTGKLRETRKMPQVLTQADAQQLVEALGKAESTATVLACTLRSSRRKPPLPLTTSTMLQEAATLLHLNSDKTSRLAKKLYEEGYVTYIRTDSTTLSEEAMSAAREQVAELFGPEAVSGSESASARATTSSQPILSQGAHEAIRPAGTKFCRPEDLPTMLQDDARKLYDLIWRRTLASQMADSHLESLTVQIRVNLSRGSPAKDMPLSVDFNAAATEETKLGWHAIWPPVGGARKANRGTPGAQMLCKGMKLLVQGATPRSHKTQPPKRYTEASLIKELEQSGIGRPSTYASIVPTLLERGYVSRDGAVRELIPTETGEHVVKLLVEHMSEFVEYNFTAAMEVSLDRIAKGQQDRESFLQHFYFGSASQRGLVGAVDKWRQTLGALIGYRGRFRGSNKETAYRPYNSDKSIQKTQSSISPADSTKHTFGKYGGSNRHATSGGVVSGKMIQKPKSSASLTASLKTASPKITFGKHKGQDMIEVIKNDRSYCRWVLKTEGANGANRTALSKFAEYIRLHVPEFATDQTRRR